jgi:hypothetical protein
MYLLRDGDKVYEYTTLNELSDHFEWRIGEDGSVYMNGNLLSVSYDMDEWGEIAIKRDVLSCGYFKNVFKDISLYKIIRKI